MALPDPNGTAIVMKFKNILNLDILFQFAILTNVKGC